METKTFVFSAADGVSRWAHSGESSGNGCKMPNSMVTEGDVSAEKRKERGRRQEGEKSE